MKSINQSVLKFAKAMGFAAVMAATITPVQARYNVGTPEPKGPREPEIRGKMTNCLPATQQRDLDVNNVRTTILNGGDMWWNLSNARYEIPKVQTGQVSKHSLFSGALWIGGVSNGNLKLAAQTYRQGGNDFYPGPLVNGTASITAEKCKSFDKIWRVTLSEVEDFVAADDKISYELPSDIETWPGNGDFANGEAARLAPYFDND
jgi:hypothetical protein